MLTFRLSAIIIKHEKCGSVFRTNMEETDVMGLSGRSPVKCICGCHPSFYLQLLILGCEGSRSNREPQTSLSRATSIWAGGSHSILRPVQRYILCTYSSVCLEAFSLPYRDIFWWHSCQWFYLEFLPDLPIILTLYLRDKQVEFLRKSISATCILSFQSWSKGTTHVHRCWWDQKQTGRSRTHNSAVKGLQ